MAATTSAVLGVDRVQGALGLGLLQLGLIQVNRDDPAAERGGDLHRRQADAARAVHRHPLARGQPALAGHCVERRHVAAADRRRGQRIDAVRQLDAVEVRVADGGVPGVAAIVGEAEELHVVAEIGTADHAVAAPPAGLVERGRHPVPGPDAGHPRADRHHRSAQLVPHHQRQRRDQAHPLPVTVPHVPVGPADAFGLDLDDRLTGSRRRIGEVGEHQRPPPLDQPGRLHARACSAAIGDSSRACGDVRDAVVVPVRGTKRVVSH